jgi:radical SAM-linked protein
MSGNSDTGIDSDERIARSADRAWKRGFSVGPAAETTLEDIRFIAGFRKEGNAALFPLHSISSIFSRAFLMMGLPVRYTEGFNPMPRMELTQPLALGMESSEDLMAVWLSREVSIHDSGLFLKAFNACLPRGLKVETFRTGSRRSLGKKSIGSLYWGSRYEVRFRNPEDFRLVSTLQLAREAFEESGIHEIGFEISLRLADAHGGERNIQSIISKALACEKPLERCSIRRTECYALQDGTLKRLFETL